MREKHGLSLEALGRRLRVGRSYLSRLENQKRTKPSRLLITMLCQTYSVRQEWLLRGQGKPFEPEYLNRAAAAGNITGLEPPLPITLEERAKSLGEFLGGLLIAGNRTNEALAEALADVLANALPLPSVTIEVARVLSEQLHYHLRTRTAPGGTSKGAPNLKTLRGVLADGTIARRSYESLLRDSLGQQTFSQKPLTGVTSARNMEPMTEIQQLIGRLRQATGMPRKKAELAKYLGVPRPRVSEWLRKHNAVTPSGETALRLLHWVEQQERPQKSSGSAETPPERKTQISKSVYEKQIKVRKKR